MDANLKCDAKKFHLRYFWIISTHLSTATGPCDKPIETLEYIAPDLSKKAILPAKPLGIYYTSDLRSTTLIIQVQFKIAVGKPTSKSQNFKKSLRIIRMRCYDCKFHLKLFRTCRYYINVQGHTQSHGCS